MYSAFNVLKITRFQVGNVPQKLLLNIILVFWGKAWKTIYNQTTKAIDQIFIYLENKW